MSKELRALVAAETGLSAAAGSDEHLRVVAARSQSELRSYTRLALAVLCAGGRKEGAQGAGRAPAPP